MKPLPAATKAELGLSHGKIEGWQASYVNVISCLLIGGKKSQKCDNLWLARLFM